MIRVKSVPQVAGLRAAGSDRRASVGQEVGNVEGHACLGWVQGHVLERLGQAFITAATARRAVSALMAGSAELCGWPVSLSSRPRGTTTAAATMVGALLCGSSP